MAENSICKCGHGIGMHDEMYGCTANIGDTDYLCLCGTTPETLRENARNDELAALRARVEALEEALEQAKTEKDLYRIGREPAEPGLFARQHVGVVLGRTPHRLARVVDDEVEPVERAVEVGAEPFDAAFHLAVSETLEEWGSTGDDEAFRDL